MDYIKPKRKKTIKGGDTLKINDEKVLAALISCGSVRKAAERSGVSVYTITKRLNTDDFRAKYEALKNNILTEACDSLTARLTLAIDTLCSVAEDETQNASIRVSASDSILRHGLRYVELAQIKTRLDRIEKQLEEQ